MKSLQQELINILEYKKITPYFYPIISSIKKGVIGYEALINAPENSALHDQNTIVKMAREHNLLQELILVYINNAIENYSRFNLDSKLFLQIHLQDIEDVKPQINEILYCLDKFPLELSNIIILLRQTIPTDDYAVLLEAASQFRENGFDIGLEDFGIGYSNLILWSELSPNYVKIDQHVIRNLKSESIQVNFIKSVQGIANSINSKVIIQNIETQTEFELIESIGESFAQGYYISRPEPIPFKKIDHLIIHDKLPTIFNESTVTKIAITQSSVVETICNYIPPVSSDTLINEVMSIFQKQIELMILPIIDNDVPVGLIFRDIFLNKLYSSRYGMELHGRKPIKTFIEQAPLLIDYNTPIESVSQALTSSMHNEQAFIITREGQYIGVATILTLLERITQKQIDNAKYANPLTLLSGSVPTNEHVDELIANNIPFAFGYFDLDNFKPFNDIYSYSAGDDIIKAVAKTLTDAISTDKGIIGHIGGDDFIVIFTNENWLETCEQILDNFKNLVPSYYKPEDVAAGGISGESRSGEKCFFPMTSLSVGLVPPHVTANCLSHVDIADLASESKKMAKKIEGNSYFINNRQSPKKIDSVTHNTP
jgi:EAL domain-containing protein (putative c-di-GMP-specific phosphodiesterase class I)/GGDEF domain-containing protein/CBS domain-containing protein